MENKKNIVFLGTPNFSLNPLISLYENHNIVLIITQPDRVNKRGNKIAFNPIKKFAIEKDIELFQSLDINSKESIDYIESFEVDYMVVVAYGQIIKKEIREIPKKEIINIHASLLPKHRGAAPIQRAIMNRDLKTGITIMEVSKGLDKGDILLSEEIEILDKKFPEVHDELSELGAKLILDYIKLNEDNKIQPQKQDEKLATYASKLTKEDGLLNFLDIDTELGKIYGLYPKPGAYFIYKDQKVKALDGRVFSNNGDRFKENGTVLDVLSDGILVNCGNGILKITSIQFPGKKEMSVEDYLKGNKIEKNIELGW